MAVIQVTMALWLVYLYGYWQPHLFDATNIVSI